MAKSKISRKKLLKEPDEFITFTGRLIQFARTYQKELIGGFAVFIGAIVIFSMFQYFSAKNEAEAARLLAESQAKYEENLSSEDAEKALAAVEKDFQRILNDYSGQMAAKHARLFFAHKYFDAKMKDKAIELYKISLKDWDDVPAVKNLVLSSLGYAYEQKNDLKTAATYFDRIKQSNETVGKATAIYNLGRIYAKLGDSKKSMEAYQVVSKDYPDFIYAEIVTEKIQP